MLQGKRLGFIGAGNMAEAMIRGVLDSGKVNAGEVTASDSNLERLNVIVEGFGIEGHNRNFEVAKLADIIILSVKPQVMKKVLADIRDEVSQDKLVVSIAAGVGIEKLAAGLKKGTKIVRVMPNTPALVLSGISVICPGAGVSDEDKKSVSAIFDAIGESVVIENEELMDAVTGLSGSGPAYVYTFIEALADAGVKVGLPRDISRRLATQTVYGSAKVAKELDRHPAELRDMVTSPGGTTIAGMGALEEKGFRAAIISAVEAATKRSRELGE